MTELTRSGYGSRMRRLAFRSMFGSSSSGSAVLMNPDNLVNGIVELVNTTFHERKKTYLEQIDRFELRFLQMS